MLGGLQMGSAAVIANSPVTNVYFNFHIYFPSCDKLNRSGLFDFPIPVQGMVSKMFRPVNDNFQNDDDPLWEAVSPISMAKDFSSPVTVNHFTADILVPVDQISGKYTYHKNNGTLPESFHTRMPDDGTGILSMTLEGQASPEEISISRYKQASKKQRGIWISHFHSVPNDFSDLDLRMSASAACKGDSGRLYHYRKPKLLPALKLKRLRQRFPPVRY